MANRLLEFGQAGTEFPEKLMPHRDLYRQMFLGRFAILRGNVQEARSRLTAAGTLVRENDFTDEFHLDFAIELLELGEADAVMDYLLACRENAKGADRSQITRLIEKIAQGKKPKGIS